MKLLSKILLLALISSLIPTLALASENEDKKSSTKSSSNESDSSDTSNSKSKSNSKSSKSSGKSDSNGKGDPGKGDSNSKGIGDSGKGDSNSKGIGDSGKGDSNSKGKGDSGKGKSKPAKPSQGSSDSSTSSAPSTLTEKVIQTGEYDLALGKPDGPTVTGHAGKNWGYSKITDGACDTSTATVVDTSTATDPYAGFQNLGNEGNTFNISPSIFCVVSEVYIKIDKFPTVATRDVINTPDSTKNSGKATKSTNTPNPKGKVEYSDWVYKSSKLIVKNPRISFDFAADNSSSQDGSKVVPKNITIGSYGLLGDDNFPGVNVNRIVYSSTNITSPSSFFDFAIAPESSTSGTLEYQPPNELEELEEPLNLGVVKLYAEFSTDSPSALKKLRVHVQVTSDDIEVDSTSYKGQNNGCGNGDQSAPGKSGSKNKAENASGGSKCPDKFTSLKIASIPPSLAKSSKLMATLGSTVASANSEGDDSDSEEEVDAQKIGICSQKVFANNGFGNGIQPAPGNSLNNNNANNSTRQSANPANSSAAKNQDPNSTTFTDKGPRKCATKVTDYNNLYIAWIGIVTYTVTYDANGGTGAPTDTTRYRPPNLTVTIASGIPTRSACTFRGWDLTQSATSATYTWNGTTFSSSTLTIGGDTTLYAIWDCPTYTVTYNANGGSGTMANQTNPANSSANLTTLTFTKSGCTLKSPSWNTQANGLGTSYANNVSYGFAADLTLYAQWTCTDPKPPKDEPFPDPTPNTPLDEIPDVVPVAECASANFCSKADIVESKLPVKTGNQGRFVASEGMVMKPNGIPIGYTLAFAKNEIPTFKGKALFSLTADKTGLIVTSDSGWTGFLHVNGIAMANGAKSLVAQKVDGINVVTSTPMGIAFGLDIQIFPDPPKNGTYKLVENGSTLITWGASPTSSAQSYEVYFNGRFACETKELSCTVKGLTGPNSNVTIVTIGMSRTRSVDSLPLYVPGKYSLALVVHFDTSKYDLKAVDVDALNKFIDVVKKLKIKSLLVVGHADLRLPTVNNDLSKVRAKVVYKYLSKRLPGVKISTSAKGDKSQVKSKTKALSLAESRRTEIFVK